MLTCPNFIITELPKKIKLKIEKKIPYLQLHYLVNRNQHYINAIFIRKFNLLQSVKIGETHHYSSSKCHTSEELYIIL